MAETCRSGRHAGQWARKANGQRYCADCARESGGRRALSTAGVDRWSAAEQARARAARLAAWQAGVDAAIAHVRRTEGFDGTGQAWQTLGEYLRPERRARRYHHAA